MKIKDKFINLKKEVYRLWQQNSDLKNFTKLPKKSKYSNKKPHSIPVTKKIKNWKSDSIKTKKIFDNIIELLPYINWKQTYSEKDVGKTFLNKFGYFELIGPTGHFFSKKISLFFIFFDVNTFYTWHNHEAEELYFVLNGKAKFKSKGDASKVLIPLKSRFHKNFQPHSLSTFNNKCLSIVVWRDKLNSKVRVVKNIKIN